MTESDWLTETDYAVMARFVSERLSPRRRRLLAAAFCRAAGTHTFFSEMISALDTI